MSMKTRNLSAGLMAAFAVSISAEAAQAQGATPAPATATPPTSSATPPPGTTPQVAGAQTGAIIQTIQVQGTQRIEDATVLSYLSLQPGDRFDEQRIDLSLKTLFATGLFADVSIKQQGLGLVVTVVENPIINQVKIEGNKNLKTDKLTKELQAKPRAVFTPARIQGDVQRIIELYRRSGRFAATVTPQVKELSQNRVDLIFEIQEGPVSDIRSINFIGNKAFSDRQLKKSLATQESHWWKFFSQKDNYDPDKMEYDREQLRKFYTNRGFADFRVVSAVAELTPDQKAFYVTFTVDEGEKYKFGQIKVETALSKLKPDALRAVVPIKEGRIYESDKIEKSIDALTYAAGTAGYAFVDIRPGINRNPDARTIDINFKLDEGPRVYIERIDVVGNTRTIDPVIRRELRLVEGDGFNRVLLDRSKTRVKALGYFKNVEVTDKPGSAPDRSIVEVKVEEQPTGEVSFSAGYSSYEKALFDISLTERNLRGRGQYVKFQIATSSRRKSIDFRFTEPRFLGRDVAAGFDLFATESDYLSEASFKSKTTGAGLRLGFPLSEYSSLGLRYTLRLDDITAGTLICGQVLRPLICRQQGEFLTSLVGYSFNIDHRDDVRNPTRGYRASFSQDFAGVGGEVQYVRSEIEGSVYRGLLPGIVASFRASAGYIEGWGGDNVRINDRFFKGGNSFRGFDAAGIGPRELLTNNTTGDVTRGDALGGKAYGIGSFELSFPLGLPKEYGISAGLFTEFGTLALLDKGDKIPPVSNATTTLSVVDDTSLRAAAGISLYWDSPFGPVQFDFSKVLAKEDYDETQGFRFTSRTNF
ncbi:MAG: outer membrane protein assembly factor BamA [Caulobacterales bacterium]